MPRRPRFRLLIVEDHRGRQETLRSWVPEGVLCAWAPTGEDAARIVRSAGDGELGAVLLDYDLHESPGHGTGRVDGRHVAAALIDAGLGEVPVLVHSENDLGRAEMVAMLRAEGFEVEAVPMSALTRERLAGWVRRAEQRWREDHGE